MTAIEGILVFLIIVVLLAAWTILVKMIARRAGYDKGFLAGREDAARDQKRFESFKREKLTEHLAEARDENRTWIAENHVVIQQRSGLTFAVLSNTSVTGTPRWEPDNLKAKVVAEALEEHRWLK